MKISLFNKALRTLRNMGSVAHAAVFRSNRPGKSVILKNFDWKYYLELYPDLRQAGLRSKGDAIKHYTKHGFFEKRIVRVQDKTLIASHEETRLQQLNNISLFNEQQRRIIKNDSYNRLITVSVVITLYNYAAYIDACLRSVLNNTLKDIEIIIVNDASTDNPLPQCRAFFSCGVPITIIDKQTNTGVAHSRNLGIQQAGGDYVFILDADDEIYPACLAEHLKTIRNNRSLIACYAAVDVYDESNSFCFQVSNNPFDIKKLLTGNYISVIAMFKRQELIACGAYSEHLLEQGSGYEDYELWLRLGHQNKSVGFIESPLSRCLSKQESLNTTADRYYHIQLNSFLKKKYNLEHPHNSRTAVPVESTHCDKHLSLE